MGANRQWEKDYRGHKVLERSLTNPRPELSRIEFGYGILGNR